MILECLHRGKCSKCKVGERLNQSQIIQGETRRGGGQEGRDSAAQRPVITRGGEDAMHAVPTH